MRTETVVYHCERCSKKLKGDRNAINIMTDLSAAYSGPWSRLHVHIIHRHGMHNDGKEEPADLCRKCTIEILQDALKRIKKGERASAGTEEVEMMKWGE